VQSVPITAAQRGEVNYSGPIRSASESVTQSEGTRTTYESSVFLPADHIEVTLVSGGSITSPAYENLNEKDNAGLTGYESV
jgi:hypothetical protein